MEPALTDSPAPTPGTTKEVRDYYSEILPYFEMELEDRGDENFWTWAASTPEGCRVLEMGAGTGRATQHLARVAARVVAFDLSPELIAVARKRLADLPHVDFLAADIRAFEIQERFDLVVAVDDPLVHLTRGADRDSAFRNAARHLAPGGRFLLEVAWFPPERRRAACDPGGLVDERTTRHGLTVREVWRCDRETRQCSARFEYEMEGRTTAEASFPARIWSMTELKRRCRTAGLEITNLWGDYDRRPWDRATSSRLIVEMRPPGD
jgi:SAM-dependent methyltransferase